VVGLPPIACSAIYRSADYSFGCARRPRGRPTTTGHHQRDAPVRAAAGRLFGGTSLSNKLMSDSPSSKRPLELLGGHPTPVSILDNRAQKSSSSLVVETCGRRAPVTSSPSMLEKDPLWQAVEAGHGALAGVVEEGRKTLRRASGRGWGRADGRGQGARRAVC